MNDNMSIWVRNAIVHNKIKSNDISFFSDRGLVPESSGLGTLNYSGGVAIRETPEGKHVADMGMGDTLPTLGRNKDGSWIAVLAQGDVEWVSSFLIDLPAGVDIDNLPIFEDDERFQFQPNFSLDTTPWFEDLNLTEEISNAKQNDPDVSIDVVYQYHSCTKFIV